MSTAEVFMEAVSGRENRVRVDSKMGKAFKLDNLENSQNDRIHFSHNF